MLVIDSVSKPSAELMMPHPNVIHDRNNRTPLIEDHRCRAAEPAAECEVVSVKPSPPRTGFLVSFALCHGKDAQLPVYPAGSWSPLPRQGAAC